MSPISSRRRGCIRDAPAASQFRQRPIPGDCAMPGHLKGVARRLRGAPTSAERVLWRELRKKQIGAFRFRRQVVLCGFIVDFACYEARLVIEVDGATHSTAQEIERDATRDARLRMAGNAVLRFTNDELF